MQSRICLLPCCLSLKDLLDGAEAATTLLVHFNL
jgi:hypothetical protein